MIKPDVSHESFTIVREYPVGSAAVFDAFADPVKKRRWFTGGEEHDVLGHEIDFRVGGSEVVKVRIDRPEFRSEEVRNDTYYLDIVPNERIIIAYSMSNMGVPFSASLQTITLEAAGTSTRLTLVEQVAFLPGSDGLDLRVQGTEILLANLGRELGVGEGQLQNS